MKIRVPSIPEEGVQFSFSEADSWFRVALSHRLAGYGPDPADTWAKVDLFRTNQNVSLNGTVHLRLQPICSRCGIYFSHQMEIPVLRHLVPHFEGPREALLRDEEEVELNAEDLEFSFYHNEEIDLAELLSEEITLALPMTFLCRENCQGLCPRCGKNLNDGTCVCPAGDETSPFKVLKGFKVQS